MFPFWAHLSTITWIKGKRLVVTCEEKKEMSKSAFKETRKVLSIVFNEEQSKIMSRKDVETEEACSEQTKCTRSCVWTETNLFSEKNTESKTLALKRKTARHFTYWRSWVLRRTCVAKWIDTSGLHRRRPLSESCPCRGNMKWSLVFFSFLPKIYLCHSLSLSLSLCLSSHTRTLL